MDIQLEKIELIKLLAETENPSIIKSIRKVFQGEKKDWWDELSEEQKADIEAGEREIENGEFVTLDEMMAILKQ
jgi:predicted transcriptional regulator